MKRNGTPTTETKMALPLPKPALGGTPAPAVFSVDALLPPEMAARAEEAGVRKVAANVNRTLALALLAGAFIALGALFSTTVTAGAAGTMPYGLTRLLAGVAFSLGLILVVVGGAELFTGNNLIIMAWANGRIRSRAMLRHWGLVYVGNFAGALGTVVLVYLSGQYRFGNGSVGAAALATAHAKLGYNFGQAVALGILCNGLVCLAVWLSYSARSTTDRILAVLLPVSAFVAAGFEHSIANMYFLPAALFIKSGAPASFWTDIGRTPADFPDLTWQRFLMDNLLPVTIGNVLGGALLVGIVYWFVYLHRSGPPASNADLATKD